MDSHGLLADLYTRTIGDSVARRALPGAPVLPASAPSRTARLLGAARSTARHAVGAVAAGTRRRRAVSVATEASIECMHP
jgi:hypothetical protein